MQLHGFDSWGRITEINQFFPLTITCSFAEAASSSKTRSAQIREKIRNFFVFDSHQIVIEEDLEYKDLDIEPGSFGKQLNSRDFLNVHGCG